MKKLAIIMLAVILLPLSVEGKKNTGNKEYDLKVMSYNIRLGTAKDGTNSWNMRYAATAMMLENQQPDVFGVQEAFDFQIEFITENCRNYKCVGVGRENGKSEGEHMSIFWNKETVSMLKWGTFWLSETPDKPSLGWDAKCKRTATWALMKDKKTGRKFYFVNTHLDHRGKEAQKNGLALIVSRIASINPQGYPMVLTGDFNITPDNPALVDLDKIMSSTRKIAARTDNHKTFNGWGKAADDRVIDYIYVSGFSKCTEYQTVTRRYDNKKYISDHYPIISTLVF